VLYSSEHSPFTQSRELFGAVSGNHTRTNGPDVSSCFEAVGYARLPRVHSWMPLPCEILQTRGCRSSHTLIQKFSAHGSASAVNLVPSQACLDHAALAAALKDPAVSYAEKMSAAIDNTQPIDAVTSIDKYHAIYIPGGHGVCFDMAENAKLQALLAQAFEAGKAVASVCHGPLSLANVKLRDGSFMVAGKKVRPGHCRHPFMATKGCLEGLANVLKTRQTD
jgi:hypothetical protein